MTAIRRLFQDHALLVDSSRDALRVSGLNPWQLRADALSRPLAAAELAVALGHIARHRGFRSNAKRDHGENAPDETSRMLRAIAATRERLGQWQTVGQMLALDPTYSARKRNRGGDFARSVLRSDLQHEARQIFAAQRRLGSAFAHATIEEAFTRLAFDQRPLQDSERLLAACPFEDGEKRTARRSYAFEMFRLLAKLATVRLSHRGEECALTPEQIAEASVDFGRQKKLSWSWLRKRLDLAPGVRFAGVGEKDEANDFVARRGNAAEGSYALRQAVGDSGWRRLMALPEQRDRIAEVLSFREEASSVRGGLVEAGVEPHLIDAVMAALGAGRFAAFSGAGHVSSKAARALIPPLSRGVSYADACAEVGYDHSRPGQVRLEDVRNPVARKAVSEMLKQVRELIRKYGLPDVMHVELARDIGKSAEERDKITRGIEDRNKQREKLSLEFADLLGHPPSGVEDMLRFELWKEQNCRCLYTDEMIPPNWLAASDNRVQVDHILPWSRFGDDSFPNKTLCLARANQQKRDRTPFEWFTQDGLDWASFAARVEGCKEMKPRKRDGFYLRKNAKEVEERFRNRNLGDTRYATRLLLGMLARCYPESAEVHVRARPGALTAKLRRSWGVDDLKKGPDGKRTDDDRHHALDAIVLAATSESMLQELTRAAQAAERSGAPRGFDFSYVRQPCPEFRQQVRAALAQVFVSRPERHRARGEAHAATIRQIREIDGTAIVFERRPIDRVTLADLDTVPDPESYGRIVDPKRLRDETVAAVREWIEAGRPKDALPRSPKGDVIRKLRVASKDKPAVLVRGGTADRGDIIRVDVFAKPDRRGKDEYYLVPIYPHQVADRARWQCPPDQAIMNGKAESQWPRIDGTFEFRFSLYPNSLIRVVKKDGDEMMGYFRGVDRNTGALKLSPQENATQVRNGIGAKTLSCFDKFVVDRLGRISSVPREVRTWHGVACT